MTTNQSWSLLRVTPRLERFVLGALLEHGMAAYAPMEIVWAKHAKIKATRTRPLLPGYVFAVISTDEDIDQVRATRGVIEIMCFNGKPRRIPAKAIGELIIAESQHAFDETWTRPKPKKGARRWKIGDMVQVTKGPFAGFSGQVTKLRSAARIELLLEIFGRITPIELDDGDATKVEEEPDEDPQPEPVAELHHP